VVEKKSNNQSKNQSNQSSRGGKRPNAGRKPGAPNRANQERIEAAKAAGLLPHEILLAVARGEDVFGSTPTTSERLDAAKAAAPYYAARLASVEVTPKDGEGNYAPLIQVYMPGNER
jgi:hypothetical protein